MATEQVAQRGNKAWTEQDTAMLLEEFYSGIDIPELAVRLERSEAAIKRKLYWLKALGGDNGNA